MNINHTSGFTAQEHVCHEALQKFYSLFLKLPRQHPDEARDAADAIHRLQDLMAVRIVRRCYPKYWPTHQTLDNQALEKQYYRTMQISLGVPEQLASPSHGETSLRKTQQVTTTVYSCQRCSQNHEDMVFHELYNSMDDWRYWATCPITKQPILLRLVE